MSYVFPKPGASHKRMKPKVGAPPNADERRHIARVGGMPCLVCNGPATVHHVTASIHGGRMARSHKRIVPLCPAHHQIQYGPFESVEALGHSGFYQTHGIDLLEAAIGLWESGL